MSMAVNPEPKTAYGESADARKFVAELREKLLVDDPATDRMIQQLGELLDALSECATILRENGGPLILDRFDKPKLHPAHDREIALRNEFGKVYRLLGLDQASPEQGRLAF
jgi:hypothetical protein